MIFKGKNFLVYGLQSSGIEASKLLLKMSANVYLYDDNEQVYLTSNVKSLIEKSAKILDNKSDFKTFYDANKNILDSIFAVVVSPAVKLDSTLLVHFKRKKVKILGELELGYLFSKSPIIAVSGTNGKTTTVSMIYNLLKEHNGLIGGNIGIPFTQFCQDTNFDDLIVLEVSSFQLETVNSFTPHIGVLLNITEDHLDRHYSMENYIYLKSKLFKNCTQSEYAVLNFDDKIVNKIGLSLNTKIVWFSTLQKAAGAYVQNRTIYFYDEPICEIDILNLTGEHNLKNALAAICVFKILGIENQEIISSLQNFSGVEFRLEKFGPIDGITYYNDSKSTNVDATIQAINAVKQPIILMVGGKDKNQDFNKLFSFIAKQKKVRHAVIFGECRNKMVQSAVNCGVTTISSTSQLKRAVEIAKVLAKPDCAVVFSPATASFDAFKNYVERGRTFNQMVINSKNDNILPVEQVSTNQNTAKNQEFTNIENKNTDKTEQKLPPNQYSQANQAQNLTATDLIDTTNKSTEEPKNTSFPKSQT